MDIEKLEHFEGRRAFNRSCGSFVEYVAHGRRDDGTEVRFRVRGRDQDFFVWCRCRRSELAVMRNLGELAMHRSETVLGITETGLILLRKAAEEKLSGPRSVESGAK